ncbi:MAG: YetF domain-containing protein, partial [Bacilli bacterium]
TDGGYDAASAPEEIYPFPLIVSGKIHKDNLKLLNLSEDWLRKEIKKKGYQSEKEILYANYENKKLFIIETCNF